MNPSTYWIDRTLIALRQAQDGAIIASGNATTELIVSGDDVVVHSQYDTFDDQRVRQAELVALLSDWRDEVVSDLESAR